MNISTDTILLMTSIWNWGAFFTSPDGETVREGLPNPWIQNQLSFISTGRDERPGAISDDLMATLGERAIAYSTVMKYLREARINPADATSILKPTSRHLEGSDEALPGALEELPFSSVQFDSSPEPHICQTPWSSGCMLADVRFSDFAESIPEKLRGDWKRSNFKGSRRFVCQRESSSKPTVRATALSNVDCS
jgi:hypothetical protein